MDGWTDGWKRSASFVLFLSIDKKFLHGRGGVVIYIYIDIVISGVGIGASTSTVDGERRAARIDWGGWVGGIERGRTR